MSKEVGKPISKEEKQQLLYELFIPSYKRRIVILGIIIILIYFIFWKVLQENNFKIFYKITLNLIELSQNIFLVFIAVLVTGYALFQAILTKNQILILCESNLNERSNFTKFNFYFYNLGLFYSSIIVFNFVFLSIFRNEELAKILFKQNKILSNKFILLLGVIIYLLSVLILMLDIKSFFKNLYVNFKLNAVLECKNNLNEKD